jgi:hypothetical protein
MPKIRHLQSIAEKEHRKNLATSRTKRLVLSLAEAVGYHAITP